MRSKMDYLSAMDIFQDLSPRDMAEIDRAATMRTFRKGKIFYMPEDTGEVLFLLKKGRVQLYRISPEGKKLIIATLGPGTFFGEMILVGQRLHNTFAEAVEDCLICVMSRSDVERLILNKPRVALRLLGIIGQRLMKAEARLEELAFKSIPVRLASLLISLAGEQGNIVTGFTHQDLAELLGTYRETVTQTLNDFKAQGIIEIGRKRISILDMEKMRRIAAP